MTSTRPAERLANLGAIAVLVLAPLVLLGPAVFGEEVFTPFDPATFPPASIAADPAALAEVHAQPTNFDVTEIPLLVVPELELAQQQIAAGRFPSWNPDARFGGPLFANGLAGMVYPPNWILLLSADPAQGLALGAYLGYAIAGVLMFAFLRACQLSALTALFGGLAFAFCGTLTANAHFYMRMNALIWLPGILLAFLRIERTNGYERIPALLGLATCVAMTWLAGFPPYAFASTVFAGLYGFSLMLREWHRAGVRTAASYALWIGGGTALGLCIAALQMAPMLAYYPESSRDLAPAVNSIAAGGFDPIGWLGMIAPTIFGEPNPAAGGPPYENSPLVYAWFSRANWVTDTAAGQGAGFPVFPPTYNFTEYTVFLGALPLSLALVGAFTRPARPRVAMLSILAILMLLATAPALLQSVYELPGMLKTPKRFAGPVAVAWITLAAIGFDSCLRRDTKRIGTIAATVALSIAAIAAVLALGVAEWNIASVIAQNYAHVIGSVDDPVAVARNYVGDAHIEAGRLRIETALWHAVRSFAIAGALLGAWSWLAPYSRLLARSIGCVVIALATIQLLDFAGHSNFTRTRPVAVDTAVQQFLRERDLEHAATGGVTIARGASIPREALDLPSGLLFPERIRDVNAYAFCDPWSHEPFRALYGPGQMTREVWPRALPDDPRLGRPWFDLIGLRYILSTEALEHAGPRVGPQLASEAGEFFVYERPNPMPRAFIVHALDVRENDADAVRRLLDADLSPRSAVVVTSDVADRLPKIGPVETPETRAVRFVHDHSDDVLLQVEAGPPGYLVLADAALSGWECTINGVVASIERGNHFMRVVALDSRGVEVRFRYNPPGLTLGLTITTLALLAAMLAAGTYIASRRRLHRVETSM